MIYRCLYTLACKSVILSNLIRNIELRMSVMYPSSKEEILKKTVRLFLSFIAFYVGVFGGAVWLGMELYIVLLLLVLVVTVTEGMMTRNFYALETKLLIKLESFVSELRYKYRQSGMLIEALREVTENSDYLMYLHGDVLIRYLQDKDEDIDYRDIAPNNLFYSLYALCDTMLTYGDKDGTLFVSNLKSLKNEINTELLKRRKNNATFNGLLFTALMPIVAIKPIEIWAGYNMPELSGYFESVQGKIITICLVLMSIVAYKLIIKLKYSVQKCVLHDRWRRLSEVFVIEWLIVLYMRVNYSFVRKLNVRLLEMGYKYSVKEFILRRFVFAILSMLWAAALVYILKLNVIIVLLVGVVVYYVIYAEVIIDEAVIRLGREEEIVRFQNIILMLMDFERIHVTQILEQMEMFATFFKKRLADIRDMYAYKGMKVFEEEVQTSGYQPFIKLMEGFLACDNTSVKDAFDDIKADRDYYMEKHKQDNEVMISNKGAIGKMIAYIPLYAVIIMKLIIPFALEGIKMINSSGL